MYRAAFVVICISLLCLQASAIPRSRNPKECSNPCHNRYGRLLCCDDSLRTSKPECPPVPRLEVNCKDSELMLKPVKVQVCNDDNDCQKGEKCCRDSCDPDKNICVFGKNNFFYFMP